MRVDEPRQDVAPADFRQERDLSESGVLNTVGCSGEPRFAALTCAVQIVYLLCDVGGDRRLRNCPEERKLA